MTFRQGKRGENKLRVKSLGAVAALIACLAVVVAVPASGDDSSGATSLYVVQLVQAPVATYGGGVAGYAATKPGKGKKLDAGSSAAQSYAGYLNAKHYERAREGRRRRQGLRLHRRLQRLRRAADRRAGRRSSSC